MSRVDGEGASDAWTAAERAQAALAVIVQIWHDLCLHSVVTAVDTPGAPGSGPVIVTLDPHPEDDGRLDELPARLIQERPTWRAVWRRSLLTVFVHTEGAMALVGGPMLLPVLTHGRGGKLTRFLPLASCRHLGLYGPDALRALQGLLGELLFAQPPSDLALMIIDQGELTPLYRDVAHLVPVTLDGETALKLLADMLQRQTSTRDALTQVRPLLLIVVEPDDGRLQILLAIITRLRAVPTTPLHVLFVQERLILRTQEPDASAYAKLYAASGISATDIAGQNANEHQYAVLQCDGERTGLFSMIVLPWPTPLQVPVEPYHGPDWQTLIPPDSPDPTADEELLSLVYGAHAHPSNVVQALADSSDGDWHFVLDRWHTLRQYHREYIIAHPNCIAIDEMIVDADADIQAAKRATRQRLDRQTWLSRLLVATPRILAAAEYARIRRQIEPQGGASVRANGKGRGDMARPVFAQATPGELVVPALEQLTQEPMIPIGFVSGATLRPGTVITAPQIADDKTATAVMETRGRRRAKDDISAGFDDLSPAVEEQTDRS